MRRGPLIVVGASRSGTSLLRSSLNGHPAIHLAGETHWFDGPRARLEDPSAPLAGDDQTRVVDHFRSLSHRPFGHDGDPAKGWLERDRLVDAARGLGGRADDHFEAFCRLTAEHDGAGDVAVWGEKTPRHVYRIDDILDAYPGARVLCMVRDPRAVVASYRDWRNQGGFDLEDDPGHGEALEREQDRTRASYHPALATALWRGAVRQAARARRTHGPGRVRAVRYEALVVDPVPTMRAVCEWLGLDYDAGMESVPVHNSSVAAFDPRGGFQRQGIDRWSERLGEAEVAAIQQVAGSSLRSAGYERVPITAQPLRAAPTLLTAPSAVLRAARANLDRIDDPVAYVRRRVASLL